MRRASYERPRTLRVWRMHLWLAHPDPNEIHCICEFQSGRFRKRGVLGCGKSRCMMCHYPKLLHRPTRQRIRSDHSYHEFLVEAGRPSVNDRLKLKESGLLAD